MQYRLAPPSGSPLSDCAAALFESAAAQMAGAPTERFESQLWQVGMLASVVMGALAISRRGGAAAQIGRRLEPLIVAVMEVEKSEGLSCVGMEGV